MEVAEDEVEPSGEVLDARKKETWQDTMENLARRFPNISRFDIAERLRNADGHGGLAAQALMEVKGSKPPPLARLVSPVARPFPNSLGPFDLVATTFDVDSFRFPRKGSNKRVWTMAPHMLQGEARSVVLSQLAGARISALTSPKHAVTLPNAAREAAGIPEDAVSFAWSYPIACKFDVPEICQSDPDLAFLAVGGFIYMGKDGSIVHVTALVPSSDGGLRFGSPMKWRPEWTKSLNLGAGKLSRIHPVTIPELREAGACNFCWVLPAELEGFDHGGFAYFFHELNERSKTKLDRDIYFPVSGNDASKSASEPEQNEQTLVSGSSSRPSDHPPTASIRPHVEAVAPWDLRLQITVTPGRDLTLVSDEDTHVLVSVQTPEGASSQLSSICVVLDVSGSMGKEAVVQGASGEKESHGLSLLDIAKHGVRTLIHTLGSGDQLCVVSFNTFARLLFPPTQMDDDGRRLAETRLERLVAGGGTDIWAGLEEGLTALRRSEERGTFGHIMVLTDGLSRNSGDVLPKLRKYKHEHGLPCSINTFGFGYKLDSAMLAEIADLSSGSFAFIPDAGFVGTVFVNAISNLLVVMARNAHLDIEAGAGAEILLGPGNTWLGIHPAEQRAGYVRVDLGNLQYGQTRDLVVPMRIRNPFGVYLGVSGQYEVSRDPREPKRIESVDADACAGITEEAILQVEQHRCRTLFVDSLKQAIKTARGNCDADLKVAQAIIREAASAMAASKAAGTEVLLALQEDANGQSSEALSRTDWYEKWGVHYLPSLMFAHTQQQCNNFKDPGVQGYGGSLFETLRDHADETFNDLPTPMPTARPQQAAKSAARPSARSSAPEPVHRAPISMASYNDCYGGCVDGASLVLLACGGQRRVADLVKGDRVMGPSGSQVEVACLVRMVCQSGCAELVDLTDSLRITPYHPVYVDNVWSFPAERATVHKRPCEALYSFILHGAPSMYIGGLLCIALGHGLKQGAAEHSYFGTSRVLHDVAKLPGFEDGLVELPNCCVRRDPATGLVCGFGAKNFNWSET